MKMLEVLHQMKSLFKIIVEGLKRTMLVKDVNNWEYLNHTNIIVIQL